MKTFKTLLVLFGIFTSHALFAQENEETEESEKSAALLQQQKEQQMNQLLFRNFKDLNTTFAIRQESGRIYLIIEIDHNINENRFFLRPTDIGIDDKGRLHVARENQAFGFKNKNVVYFPVIEVETTDSKTKIDLFSLKTVNHRTQQQIDVTQILTRGAESHQLIDHSNRNYGVAEIHELAFVFNFVQEGAPVEHNVARFNLSSLVEGKTIIIEGKTPIQPIPILLSAQREKSFVPKVPINVLARYISPLINDLETPHSRAERPKRILKLLESLPIDFETSEMPRIVQSLDVALSAEEIIEILMKEQYRLQTQAPLLCRNIFQ